MCCIIFGILANFSIHRFWSVDFNLARNIVLRIVYLRGMLLLIAVAAICVCGISLFPFIGFMGQSSEFLDAVRALVDINAHFIAIAHPQSEFTQCVDNSMSYHIGTQQHLAQMACDSAHLGICVAQ